MDKKKVIKSDKKVGDSLYWMDVNGSNREGKILEIKGNLATVEMKNGNKVQIPIE